jgi:hypothetical protein
MDDKKPYQGTRARKRQRLVIDLSSDPKDGKRQGEPLAPEWSDDAKPDPTPRDVPLARVVGKFIKPGYPRAPVHWRALRRLLFLLKFGSTNSDQQDPDIVGVLGRPQKAVLALLEEWWTGQAHDTFLPKIKYWLFLSALGDGKAPENKIFKFRFAALKNLASDEDLPFLYDVAEVQELFSQADRRHDDCLKRIQFDFDDIMENNYHFHMVGTFF